MVNLASTFGSLSLMPKTSDEKFKNKPWAKLRISRKKYSAAKPWKAAKMSRKKFEAIITSMPDEAIEELRLQADAERLLDEVFGKNLVE